MTNKYLKTFIILIVACLLFYTSCYKNKDVVYHINYELNGGTINSEVIGTYTGKEIVDLPSDCTKDGYEFVGWYLDESFNGENYTYLGIDETGDKTFYAKWQEKQKIIKKYTPKNELNPNHYNLGGVTLLIQINNIDKHDPTSKEYKLSDKNDRIEHLSLVENAYNCKIKYYEWEAEWGAARISYIWNNYIDNSFFKKSNELTYICNVNSSWIGKLAYSNCITPLYNLETNTGLFADYGYEQEEILNSMCTYKNNVYGYSSNTLLINDCFLYYNIDLLEECGLEDPAELWLKGKWTYSKFVSWAKEAQESVHEKTGCYALDLIFTSVTNFTAAQGAYFINPTTYNIEFTEEKVEKITESFIDLWNNNLVCLNRGAQTVNVDFASGLNLVHDGFLYYINDENYFGQNNSNLNLGVVPYPLKDNSLVVVRKSPYIYFDSEDNFVYVDEPLRDRKGNVLTDDCGAPIYGVDLTYSNYKCPYYDTDTYVILNKTLNDEINSDIVFSVLNDYLGNYNNEFNSSYQTKEEKQIAYLNTLFNNKIDIDVIMSVQDTKYAYYEMIFMLQNSMNGWYSDYYHLYGAMNQLIFDPFKRNYSVHDYYTMMMKPMFEEELLYLGYKHR